MSASPPCILHEDDHLLVVLKPAGMNTHAPAAYAGEGIYDWLRHREPRWNRLAIIHRLDKDTSGVLVFAKTERANRSLTEQFARRQVRKQYLLLTDRAPAAPTLVVRLAVARRGDRYEAGETLPNGQPAETRFRVVERGPRLTVVEAEPVTGRTHQIRVHAASQGFPVLGDTLYGGSPHPRHCLHAREVRFRHPATDQPVVFRAEPDFAADSRLALRRGLVAVEETEVFRLVHGAGDGEAGWYVDRLGDYLLSQSAQPPDGTRLDRLRAWMEGLGARGVYHKHLERRLRETTPEEASPRLLFGQPAPERFVVRENGLRFELSFREGYSVGLFLDQRDNRRRLLTGHVAAGFPLFPESEPRPITAAAPGLRVESAAGSQVLNTFAYTCGFSVCAARAGARATSLDLSKKYLEWGRRNFALNGQDPAAHDFIYGDALGWLRRLAKKGRRFDLVVLDPPTFSQSREHGPFSAERDYPGLIAAALPLVREGGVILASTNAARLPPAQFVEDARAAVAAAGRQILRQHYAPQPPDFPIGREEPAHLKSLWLRLD